MTPSPSNGRSRPPVHGHRLGCGIDPTPGEFAGGIRRPELPVDVEETEALLDSGKLLIEKAIRRRLVASAVDGQNEEHGLRAMEFDSWVSRSTP